MTRNRQDTSDLAIVSAYPPPYGGVSVEVERLMPLLDRRGVRYVVYNAVSESTDGRSVVPVARRRALWTLLYTFTGREPAVYLMSGRLLGWLLGAFMARFRGRRVAVQLRNSALADWLSGSLWHRFWAGLALRNVTRVVCVSHLLEEAARAVGVDPLRILWSPAFLPPVLTPLERERVAPEVWGFASSHRPLIAANGKVLWHQGQDLYGLDHLVELAVRLKSDFPDLGIVVCFWDHFPEDEGYLEALRRRAAEKGVGANILFNTRSGVFVPVMEAADLLLRPTNTDGDAVSVREALYLGLPTLASDAVERPAGTILFRTRDLDDMESKVRAVLQGPGGRDARHRQGLCEEDQRRIEAYLEMLEWMARGDAGGRR